MNKVCFRNIYDIKRQSSLIIPSFRYSNFFLIEIVSLDYDKSTYFYDHESKARDQNLVEFSLYILLLTSLKDGRGQEVCNSCEKAKVCHL